MVKSLVDLAYEVASVAHSGQVDKAGKAYIEHPVAVASMVSDDTAKIVALLHDVVEDTAVTLQDLSAYGFPVEVITAVDCLTKRTGETRSKYLDRVKSNSLAITVKLADLAHNSNLSRIAKPAEKDYTRAERYREEIKAIQKAHI